MSIGFEKIFTQFAYISLRKARLVRVFHFSQSLCGFAVLFQCLLCSFKKQEKRQKISPCNTKCNTKKRGRPKPPCF